MFPTLGLLLMVALPTDAPVPEQDRDVSRIEYRDFRMPVRVDPDRADEIESLTIFVSTDHGLTWTEVMAIRPDEKWVEYHARADGLYWFTVQIHQTDGEKYPSQLNPDVADIRKVSVDTARQRNWAVMKPAE